VPSKRTLREHGTDKSVFSFQAALLELRAGCLADAGVSTQLIPRQHFGQSRNEPIVNLVQYGRGRSFIFQYGIFDSRIITTEIAEYEEPHEFNGPMVGQGFEGKEVGSSAAL
jgi:hypothetical protein